MAERTGQMAFPGAGSADRYDIDGLGQETAAAQSLDLHARGGIETVEVERAEGLAGQ
jgi:hypothetical protein